MTMEIFPGPNLVLPPSTLNYVGTGSNTVTQTYQDRLRKFLLATDYDTFDHAVAAALAAGKPLFAPGAYTTAGNLTLTSGATIIGDGAATSGITITHATNPLFNITGSYVTIQGLSVGPSVTRTTSANGYFNVSGSNCTIRRNIIGGAYNGIVATNAAALLRVDECQISIISSGTGIQIGTTTGAGAVAQVIEWCLFNGAGFSSIHALVCGDLTIAGCQIGGASHCLYVDPAGSQVVVSIDSINTFYDQALANNISILPTSTGAVGRLTFTGGGIAGAPTNNVSIAPAGSSVVSDVLFNGVRNTSCPGNGLAATTDGGGTVSFIAVNGGSFGNNGTAISLKGVSGGVINGAQIGQVGGLSANTTGISLSGTTDAVAITGNVCIGNGTDFTNTSSGTINRGTGNVGITDF